MILLGLVELIWMLLMFHILAIHFTLFSYYSGLVAVTPLGGYTLAVFSVLLLSGSSFSSSVVWGESPLRKKETYKSVSANLKVYPKIDPRSEIKRTGAGHRVYAFVYIRFKRKDSGTPISRMASRKYEHEGN